MEYRKAGRQTDRHGQTDRDRQAVIQEGRQRQRQKRRREGPTDEIENREIENKTC